MESPLLTPQQRSPYPSAFLLHSSSLGTVVKPKGRQVLLPFKSFCLAHQWPRTKPTLLNQDFPHPAFPWTLKTKVLIEELPLGLRASSHRVLPTPATP